MAYIDMPPLERLQAIIESHRIYMRALGFVEDARFYQGVNPAALRMMHYMGRHATSTVGQIANGIRISPSNASHGLAELRRRGFAIFEVDSLDRRNRLYQLTPAGKRLATAWDRHIEGAIFRVVSSWPLDKQDAVGALMVDLSRLLSYLDW